VKHNLFWSLIQPKRRFLLPSFYFLVCLCVCCNLKKERKLWKEEKSKGETTTTAARGSFLKTAPLHSPSFFNFKCQHPERLFTHPTHSFSFEWQIENYSPRGECQTSGSYCRRFLFWILFFWVWLDFCKCFSHCILWRLQYDCHFNFFKFSSVQVRRLSGVAAVAAAV
jgi:hypothetical protein